MTNYGITEDKKTCSPDMQRIEERITAVKLSSSLWLIDRWWYNVFKVTFLIPSRHIHNWKGVWESDYWQKGFGPRQKNSSLKPSKMCYLVFVRICVLQKVQVVNAGRNRSGSWIVIDHRTDGHHHNYHHHHYHHHRHHQDIQDTKLDKWSPWMNTASSLYKNRTDKELRPENVKRNRQQTDNRK